MAMVRTPIAILAGRTSKLRHCQNYNVVHSLAEIGIECGDPAAELLQQVSKLTARVAFVHVCIPTANIRESYFKSYACFDQLRNLQQRITKRRAWILRPVLGLILCRINFL